MAYVERDFPVGHPSAPDTVIGSPDHKAWLIQHEFLENKRDFPPGSIKAVDTPGNLNNIPTRAGVDPLNPDLEEFTGRTPQHAAAVREFNRNAAATAKESVALPPVDATTANAALEAKRKELNVDVLTSEQTQEVLDRRLAGR